MTQMLLGFRLVDRWEVTYEKWRIGVLDGKREGTIAC